MDRKFNSAVREFASRFRVGVAMCCLMCLGAHAAEPKFPKELGEIKLGESLSAALKTLPSAHEFTGISPTSRFKDDPRLFLQKVDSPASAYGEIAIVAHNGRICAVNLAARAVDQRNPAGFKQLISDLLKLWGPGDQRHQVAATQPPPNGKESYPSAAISWRLEGGTRAIFQFMPTYSFTQKFGQALTDSRTAGLTIYLPNCLSSKTEREVIPELQEVSPGNAAELFSEVPGAAPEWAHAQYTECIFKKTSEAAQTVRVTVCLNGTPGGESRSPLIGEVSLQIENIAPDAIQLRRFSELRDEFDAVIAGDGGEISRRRAPVPDDSPESHKPLNWDYVSLKPGESYRAKVAISELLATPPVEGRLYRVRIAPRFTFTVSGKEGSFFDNYNRMMRDEKYEHRALFRDVRLR